MNPRHNALKRKTKDPRDFSHSKVFGSIAIIDLPTHDFLVAAPLEIKNQDINYSSDYCTSYAASECAEDEDQVIFCPEWTFSQAKKILSDSEGMQVFDDYGLQLRDICNAGVQKGFLPRIYDPFKCDTNTRPPRNKVVVNTNWPNWGMLEGKAYPYRKASYFAVDGNGDFFDQIRAILWKNLGERRSVIVGCMWRGSWSMAKDGIVSKVYESNGYAHAFKICGQKTIMGEIHLIAQLSDGTTFGDNGYFYFPRVVVNSEFEEYGAYTFSNLQRNKAEWYVDNGVSILDPVWVKITRWIANLIRI